MITIEHNDFCRLVNQYAEVKIRELRQLLNGNEAFIDRDFAEQTIGAVGTFAAVIHKQGLQDTTMFTQDVAFAQRLHDDYESFGDYCYDIMKQVFKATNEALLANNQLMNDLLRFIPLDMSDLVVTSNYIALNNFSNVAKLELTNFKVMNDIGICYDIALSPRQIKTTNIVDRIQPTLGYYIELSEFLQALQNEQVQELLKTWTENVNGRLQLVKDASVVAWHSTYAAMRELLQNAILQKQVGRCICNMHVVGDRITETLHYKQHTKTVDWQIDRNVLVALDYFNNLNFRFVD